MNDLPGGLTVRRYARLAALLRAAGASSTATLERQGVTEEAWKAASTGWTRAIDSEVARGEHDLLLAYAEEFRAMERRGAEEPGGEAVVDPPGERAELQCSPGMNPSMPHEMPPAGYVAPSHLSPPMPPGPAGVPALASTAALDARALISAALPFMQGSAPPSPRDSASPAPSPRAVPNPPAPRVPTGTILDLHANATPALPFGGAPTDKALHPPSLGSTAVLDIQAAVAAATPFVPAAPAPAASAAEAPPAPVAPALPELSFEQYVAMCAELSISPARITETLARYHTDRTTIQDLHAVWRKRMGGDAEWKRRYDALYAHYQAWFAREPK